MTCVWIGTAVKYYLKVNGKAYGSESKNSLYSAPYDITIVESDYNTFARFIIDVPEAKCLKKIEY